MADGKRSWSGTYVALFQPGEEIGAGAQAMLDDGLVRKIPKPDVAVAQHVMPGPAGRIGTAAGPILSAADSIKVVLYGKGAHGSMPHESVDPVVLAASVVLRLQTIVARELKPGSFAVVTVGSLQAGTKANIIADEATLLLNLRTYDPAVRDKIIASIERIVTAECAASGSPRAPEIDFYEHYPLTSNSAQANDRITAAFRALFGAKAVYEQSPVTASEDFSAIPNAFGIPYTYWCIGGTDPARYAAAVAHHTVDRDIPSNHSPSFAPVIDPTLRIGTEAQVVAALSYLAPAA
jgi:amidohydrolase